MNRLPLLDAARAVAAVGVVAAHVLDELFPGDPLKILGTYAVPFYLFVALYFTVRGLVRDPSRPLGTYILGRVWKLYLPFLVWNVVYDLLHIAKHRGDELTPLWLIPWAAFYTHLYFLPFLLIITVGVSLIARPLASRVVLRRIVSLTLIVIACAVGFARQPTWLDDSMRIEHETIWNVYRAVPAACFAAAFALTMGIRSQRLRVSGIVALAAIALSATCVYVQWRFGPYPVLRSASGFGLAIAAFGTFDSALLRPVAWAGRLSFGVYLSHVAFIRVGMAVLGGRVASPGWGSALAVGAFAFTAGLLFSALVARSRWTRWIIGCEHQVSTRAARGQMSTIVSTPTAVRSDVERSSHTLKLDPTV